MLVWRWADTEKRPIATYQRVVEAFWGVSFFLNPDQEPLSQLYLLPRALPAAFLQDICIF